MSKQIINSQLRHTSLMLRIRQFAPFANLLLYLSPSGRIRTLIHIPTHPFWNGSTRGIFLHTSDCIFFVFFILAGRRDWCGTPTTRRTGCQSQYTRNFRCSEEALFVICLHLSCYNSKLLLAFETLSNLLRSIEAYLTEVLEHKLPLNQKIMCILQEVFFSYFIEFYFYC